MTTCCRTGALSLLPALLGTAATLAASWKPLGKYKIVQERYFWFPGEENIDLNLRFKGTLKPKIKDP